MFSRRVEIELPVAISAHSRTLEPEEIEKQEASMLYTFFYRMGMGLNVSYSAYVSVLFAIFTARRAHKNVFEMIGYSSSSFLVNFPMALFFAFAFGNAITRLKKMQPFYMVAFTLSFGLAALTVGAALQVAVESVELLTFLPNFMDVMSIGASSFNTLSTRFVGSILLIYSLFMFVRASVLRMDSRYRPYYLYLDDLALHAELGDASKDVLILPDEPPIKRIHSFAEPFYKRMSDKKISPGYAWHHLRRDALILAANVALVSVFIVNFQPLWLKLTEEGLGKMNQEALAASPVIVWLAATSSELFYLYSGFKFLPSLYKISSILAKKTHSAIKEADQGWKKMMIPMMPILFFSVWGVLTYCSGQGYGEDGLEAIQDGFGKVANDTWFTTMGWFTNPFLPAYANVIIPGASGVIVNGGAVLRFLMEKVPFFKPDSASDTKKSPYYSASDARDDLHRMLEEGEWDALESYQLLPEILRCRTDAVDAFERSSAAGSRVTLFESGVEGDEEVRLNAYYEYNDDMDDLDDMRVQF